MGYGEAEPTARLLSGSLARYVIAAILARMATGGSAVAIILLARSYGEQGMMAGAMAACLTAPHLLGPVYGKSIEKSSRPLHIIALACVLFSGGFQLAIWGFEWQWPGLVFLALLVCGCCSSFLMGGLSTQLLALVDNQVTVRRRAQSWDTLSYGIGLTLGPFFIALLTAHYPYQLVIGVIMALPLATAIIILRLSRSTKVVDKHGVEHPGIRQILSIVFSSGPLKRTLLMTSSAAFCVAALPIVAIYFAASWQQSQTSGAYLVTFYGVGCILGGLLIMLKPLRDEATALLFKVGVMLLITLLVVGLSQNFTWAVVGYLLCGVVNSIFFAVTLAARSEYSPEKGAAQIYMWVAAAKIGAASLGTLVAGILVDKAIYLPLIMAIVVLTLSLVLCFGRQSQRRQNHTATIGK